MANGYDFSGWATKNNIACSDGRTIRKDAFKHCDGLTVPLVWNHQHNDSLNVLGHALLENRNEGVYAYCSLNETESGQNAKELIKHGDVKSLSIYANHLKQNGGDVLHGDIREVSLVLAGANPGASIDSVMIHGDHDEYEEGFIIRTDDDIEMYHAEETEETEEVAEEKKDKTVQDVIDSMNEEQKKVLYAMVGQALEEDPADYEDEAEHSDIDYEEDYLEHSEGGTEMKHNVFEGEVGNANVLSHADTKQIFTRGKQLGSLREAWEEFAEERAASLSHADGDPIPYGIEDNIDWLFPDPKSLNATPEWINKRTDWASKVIRGVHHTPFSRIKSVFADIREDEARAKGYTKGNLKKEEVFSLLKRSTLPTTIYKKQKLDRDDIIDITDFDVVAWIKGEMRMKLDEEIARAILLGDGRLSSDDDKIDENCIRPIWKDASLYNITIDYATALTDFARSTDDNGGQYSDWANPKALIRALIASRKEYRGSGQPTLFISESLLTEMLLIEDNNGRVIYDSVDKLATALRVSEIVSVEAMDDMYNAASGTSATAGSKAPVAIIVNLDDYNVGADKGGAVNMFDDFDIDYNQQKYLMETRCSGALTKPYSAITMVYTKPSTGENA